MTDGATVGGGIQVAVFRDIKATEVAQAGSVHAGLLQGRHAGRAALVRQDGRLLDVHVLAQDAHQHRLGHAFDSRRIDAEALQSGVQAVAVRANTADVVAGGDTHDPAVAADDPTVGRQGRGAEVHDWRPFKLGKVRLVGDLANLDVRRHAGAIAPLIVGLGHGGLDVAQVNHGPLRRNVAIANPDLGVLTKDGATRRAQRCVSCRQITDDASSTQNFRRVLLDDAGQLLRRLDAGVNQAFDLAHLFDLVNGEPLEPHKRVSLALPMTESVGHRTAHDVQAATKDATKGDIERRIGHAVVSLLVAGSTVNDRLDHCSARQALNSTNPKAW